MSASPSDRNVLFGVLALQMEFITQAGLIAGLQAWTLQKTKPLGELLVHLGQMSADDRAALEPMVDRHVARHGGSAEQSLAALSSVSGIASVLRPIGDDELQQTLTHLQPGSSQPSARPYSADAEGDRNSTERFELLREHAEGGLGKVWVARDRELNREVAFKEIKSGREQDQDCRDRFLLEAEITGGLEHPGIVPVYSLGHHAGRPFYAMRFIRGDSLKEAVQQFHASAARRPAAKSDPNAATVIGDVPVRDPVATVARPWEAASAADDNKAGTSSPRSGERGYEDIRREAFESVEFRRLLGRFVDVCNAVEYAHSRGVLHRDLKPGNIMLGKYGETLVVDWGLAKAGGRGDQFQTTGEVTLVPSSGSSIEQTSQGTVIGTPAYMSPEQAAGKLEDLGPATDVYSLGATLFHLLTGQTPIVARPREAVKAASPPAVTEILRRVVHGEFARPREVNPEIPRPLEAICLRAMSLRPRDRYASATDLAADLERWLAGDAVSAWSEPLAVRAKRWVRRHQVAVTSLAAAVLVGLVGLGVLSAVVSNSNQRLTAANTTIGDQNLQITGKNKELQTSNDHERSARLEADDQRASAVRSADEARAVLTFFQDKVLAAARPETQAGGLGVNVTIREAIDAAEPLIADAFPDQPLVEASIRSSLGTTYLYLRLGELAIRQHERARDLRESKLGSEHPDTLLSMGNLGRGYHAAGKLDQALPLLEQTLELMKVKLGPEHPRTLVSMSNLALGYHAAGKLDQALPLWEKTLELMKAKLGPEDPDTLSAMNNLAEGYRTVGKLDQALPLYEQTLELMKVKLGPEHPDTLTAMNNLAAGYKDAGKLDQALPLLEQTLELMKAKLGPKHPDTLGSMNNLAAGYSAAGKLELAFPLHEQALELIKAKLGPEHPDTLTAMNNLAMGYKTASKFDQALPLLEQTLELLKAKLGPEHPNTLGSMNNLAQGYEAAGKLDLAFPLYEQTLKLMKAKLGPEHPSTLTLMNNLAMNYRAAGKLDQALPLLEQTLELIKAKLGPEHPNTLMSMNNLAGSYRDAGKLDQALPLFEESLKLMKAKLGPDHPNTLVAMNNLGLGYSDAGKLNQALPLLEKTLELRKAKLGPEHLDTLGSMGSLAKAYLVGTQPEKALPLFDQFIAGRRRRATPDDPSFAGVLAAVSVDLSQHRQYPAAEIYLRECLTIREKKLPDNWVLFNTKSMLGGALAGQKKFQEAEPLLVEGYEGLKDREAKIPPASKTRLPEAIRRLVDFYTAWEKPEKTAEWKAILDKSMSTPESSPNLK